MPVELDEASQQWASYVRRWNKEEESYQKLHMGMKVKIDCAVARICSRLASKMVAKNGSLSKNEEKGHLLTEEATR